MERVRQVFRVVSDSEVGPARSNVLFSRRASAVTSYGVSECSSRPASRPYSRKVDRNRTLDEASVR